MATLQLNLLGGVEILRDGTSMALPPSRKTRALLAYLALNHRSFSRDHLCELLWEIPDDPRGSLRWSLSKLRRLVDDESRARVVADRATVALDVGDVDIDVVSLKAIAGGALDETPIGELERAERQYQGHFLEGLELSNFHTFHAWCVAEREAVAQAQSAILRALVYRLAAEPPKAIPHARRLVAVSPYDESARSRLIELLSEDGRHREAEEQYRLGVRLLKEIGKDASVELYRALHGQPDTRQTTTHVDHETPTAPPERPMTLLAGRDDEMRALSDTLKKATERGTPHVVLIQGIPGLGKTRLLEDAVGAAADRGATVLHAASFESEAVRPFSVWMDALRRVDPNAVDDIFEAEAIDNRERFFDRLGQYIGSCAEQGLTVVALDDVQWCDESSIAALHFVVRMNRTAPMVILLAARSDELRDNAAVQKAIRGFRHDGMLQELRLSPLSEYAIREIIEAQSPEVDSQALCDKCGGNPLLAIELARAERSGLSGSSLEELIAERLDALEVDSAEILRWASVLSPRVDVEALSSLSGVERYRVAEALEQGERQAVLVQADQHYRFTHELIAHSIYAGISPARREVMHRYVAEWLEAKSALDVGQAAELAHHASLGGYPALAARAMVSAARLCLRFFANEDALALAQKGLHWIDQLPDADAVRLTLELHDVMLSAAPVEDWEAAVERYISLAEKALDYGAIAHARLGYHMASYLRWMHGQWAGAREQTLQAERVTRAGSEEDHIIGMAETARCLAMIERDLTEADAMLMEAASLAQRKRIRHPSLPQGLGILRYYEGAFDEASGLFDEARTLFRSTGDRLGEFEAIEHLVMIDIEKGDFEEAGVNCRILCELGANLRDGSEGPFSVALTGLCTYALDDASDDLESALESLRIADAKHRLAYILLRAALIDVERGRTDAAIVRATEALEYAELLERRSEMTMAHLVMVMAYDRQRALIKRGKHRTLLYKLTKQPIATWARDRALELLDQGDE